MRLRRLVWRLFGYWPAATGYNLFGFRAKLRAGIRANLMPGRFFRAEQKIGFAMRHPVKAADLKQHLVKRL